MIIFNVVTTENNHAAEDGICIGRTASIKSYTDFDVACNEFRKLREAHLSLLIHDTTYRDWKVREDEAFSFLIRNEDGEYIDIGMFNGYLEVENETYSNP